MPADSLFYISSIQNYIEFNDVWSTSYKSFVVILGELAKIFSLSAVEIYYYQFYAGVVFSAFVLVQLGIKVGLESKSILILLLCMAVFKNMPGSNFWVVPNYWSVYLVLYVFTISMTDKWSGFSVLWLMLAIFFGTFLHRSFSFYGIALSFIYVFASYLLLRRVEIKMLVTLACFITFYLFLIFLETISPKGNMGAYVPQSAVGAISFTNFKISIFSTYNQSFLFLVSPLLLGALVSIGTLKRNDKLHFLLFSGLVSFMIFSFHYRSRGVLVLTPLVIIWCVYGLSILKGSIFRRVCVVCFLFINAGYLTNHVVRLNAINDIAEWDEKPSIPKDATAISVWPWLIPSIMSLHGFKDYTVNLWDREVVIDRGVIVLPKPETTYFANYNNSIWDRIQQFIKPCNYCRKLLGHGVPDDSIYGSLNGFQMRLANKHSLHVKTVYSNNLLNVYQFYKINESN